MTTRSSGAGLNPGGDSAARLAALRLRTDRHMNEMGLEPRAIRLGFRDVSYLIHRNADKLRTTERELVRLSGRIAEAEGTSSSDTRILGAAIVAGAVIAGVALGSQASSQPSTTPSAATQSTKPPAFQTTQAKKEPDLTAPNAAPASVQTQQAALQQLSSHAPPATQQGSSASSSAQFAHSATAHPGGFLRTIHASTAEGTTSSSTAADIGNWMENGGEWFKTGTNFATEVMKLRNSSPPSVQVQPVQAASVGQGAGVSARQSPVYAAPYMEAQQELSELPDAHIPDELEELTRVAEQQRLQGLGAEASLSQESHRWPVRERKRQT